MKVTAEFVEEYGFLLNKKTVQMFITRKNVALFPEMCKKIQFIAGNDKPILLKNPYDFPNFLYIKQVFPNARFVFIHRNPLKTISSTLNAIKMILKNNKKSAGEGI
ncbi:MAG: sulfotransferase [Thermoplasmata archaeon]|nr:sulfotransferase [Thermoplasmata archaeon]MBE3137360.1 sulfotransferase [Thermoplasmata archaeon]